MKVRRLNRVELLLPGEDLPEAVRVYNELLGGHLPPPEEVPGQEILSTIDYRLGIEFFGPRPDSERAALFEDRSRRGSIGPVVWEVDDLEALKREITGKGYRISFEFGELGSRSVYLDASQWFGFVAAFTERASATAGPPPTRVTRLQRVELPMPGKDIEPARQAFNDLLGGHLPPPHHLPEYDFMASVDLGVGLELNGPASVSKLDGPPGMAGPLIWEVADLDEARQQAEAGGFAVAHEFGERGERQIHFDPGQLFGYSVAFTERRTAPTG